MVHNCGYTMHIFGGERFFDSPDSLMINKRHCELKRKSPESVWSLQISVHYQGCADFWPLSFCIKSINEERINDLYSILRHYDVAFRYAGLYPLNQVKITFFYESPFIRLEEYAYYAVSDRVLQKVYPKHMIKYFRKRYPLKKFFNGEFTWEF